MSPEDVAYYVDYYGLDRAGGGPNTAQCWYIAAAWSADDIAAVPGLAEACARETRGVTGGVAEDIGDASEQTGQGVGELLGGILAGGASGLGEGAATGAEDQGRKASWTGRLAAVGAGGVALVDLANGEAAAKPKRTAGRALAGGIVGAIAGRIVDRVVG